MILEGFGFVAFFVGVCVYFCGLSHERHDFRRKKVINPLNAQLNPICHLLVLLGAHHILHISKLRVKHKMFVSIFSTTFV
jgi:hypothetical protein